MLDGRELPDSWFDILTYIIIYICRNICICILCTYIYVYTILYNMIYSIMFSDVHNTIYIYMIVCSYIYLLCGFTLDVYRFDIMRWGCCLGILLSLKQP